MTDEPTQAPPATDEPTSTDDPTGEDTEHGAGAAGHPGTELEAGAPEGQPPVARAAPPRRTGVFVDPADLRDHVGELLRALLGGYEVDAQGNYAFVHETARIFVTFGATPVGPTVGVFSVTNIDLDLTDGLANFLLQTNHRMSFGAFSYDAENRAVWLKHTLLGTTLDLPELQAALMAIAQTAAQVDDHIRDQFGGRTFHEVPEEQQQRTRPPESAPDGDQGDVVNASGYL